MSRLSALIFLAVVLAPLSLQAQCCRVFQPRCHNWCPVYEVPSDCNVQVMPQQIYRCDAAVAVVKKIAKAWSGTVPSTVVITPEPRASAELLRSLCFSQAK